MNVQPSRFFEGTPRKTVAPASPAKKTSDLLGFSGDMSDKSPRRVTNHQKSHIFNGVDTNDNSIKMSPSPARSADTKSRLFGEKADPCKSPRRLNASATFSSSVFIDKPVGSPKHTPKRTIASIDRNPITGITKSPSVGPELMYNGHADTNGHSLTNGHSTVVTNGVKHE